MSSATRMAALVAALAVGGSLALLTGPLAPQPEMPVAPGAEAPGPEAAARFYGTGMVRVIQQGKEIMIDGVPHLVDNVSEMPAEWKEVTDPRAGGTGVYTQIGADYGGFGPTWGSFRIEDDDGAWVGDVSGLWYGNSTQFSGWLTGEGVYGGLIMYHHVDFKVANDVSISGLIYPADIFPLELEVGLTD